MAFDCETVGHQLDESTIEHRLEFGWVCYSRWIKESRWSEPQWFRFSTGNQLWEWIGDKSRSKQETYVYCHNVNFDWQATSMCQILPALGWICDQAIIEDPPNAFRWRRDNKTLRLLDSFNYFYTSVAKIGNRIGLPKLEMPADWSNSQISDEYCKRDALIVLRAIQEWIAWLREHQLGSLTISLAAQSMSAYKHRFLTHPIYIDDNEKAIELARESYVGGRTEAWQVGTYVENITCLDINSMYPYLMREYEYPTRLHGIYRNVSFDEITRWLPKYSVVASVTLNTPDPIYPERANRKLIFPTGTFSTALCSPELQCALDHGHVLAIHSAAIYDRAPIFREYMDTMYALRLHFREQGDTAADYFTKKLIASFYGKWGQRGGKEEIIGHDDDTSLWVEDEIDIDSGKRYRIRHIAGLILSRSLDEESRDSHPAICSHVTSGGRMMLWKLIAAAGSENVYYMDTDSLHVNAAGLSRLDPYIDPNRLGALKLEKTIARAIYYGPKDYWLDGERKIKGIRANATEVGPAVYEQESFVSLRGSCARGHSGGPLIRTVRKKLRRVYTKGDVTASGRVLPFRRDRS